jgi:hypothetical protein
MARAWCKHASAGWRPSRPAQKAEVRVVAREHIVQELPLDTRGLGFYRPWAGNCYGIGAEVGQV